MKRALVVLIALISCAATAAAQQPQAATVVPSCGSVTYDAGRPAPLTQTTDGKLCGAAAITGAIPSQGYTAAVQLTRPANTTAYAANSVVGPTAAALTFPNMGPSGWTPKPSGDWDADAA